MPDNTFPPRRAALLIRAASVVVAVVAAIASTVCVLLPQVPAASAQQIADSGGPLELIESVIPRNDTNWRYNEALTDLGTGWRGLDYVYGSDWKTGHARFSNDACCNTILNVSPYENAVYLRKEFTINKLDEIKEMMVSFQYDDAAILWLNGTEVYRTIRGNLPATGEVPYDYDVMTGGAEDLYVEMPGTNYVEQNPLLGNNLQVWVPAIDPAHLREGNNVFAIMLFNRRGSTDTSTDLALQVLREIPAATATPVPPTPTPTIDPPASVVSETTCLDSRGRVDVTITNPASAAKTYRVLIGALDRSATVAAGSAQTVTVTGRSDGPLTIAVRESGTTLRQESVLVNCAPNVEVMSETSCLDSNGRLDFWLKNLGYRAATYTVRVGNLSPRIRAVFPGQRTRVAVTGRPDGPTAWEVTRDGTPIAGETATIDCDPNVPVTIATSCISGDGRIDVYLNNSTMTTNRYTVTINSTLSRFVDLDTTRHGRITVTGRRDGDYSIMVWENQTAIHNQPLTIACDE